MSFDPPVDTAAGFIAGKHFFDVLVQLQLQYKLCI